MNRFVKNLPWLLLIAGAIILFTSCATSAGIHNRHLRKMAKIERQHIVDSIRATRTDNTNVNVNGLGYYNNFYNRPLYNPYFNNRYWNNSGVRIVIPRRNKTVRRVVPKVIHNNPNSRPRVRTTPNVVRRPVRTKNKQ